MGHRPWGHGVGHGWLHSACRGEADRGVPGPPACVANSVLGSHKDTLVQLPQDQPGTCGQPSAPPTVTKADPSSLARRFLRTEERNVSPSRTESGKRAALPHAWERSTFVLRRNSPGPESRVGSEGLRSHVTRSRTFNPVTRPAGRTRRPVSGPGTSVTEGQVRF